MLTAAALREMPQADALRLLREVVDGMRHSSLRPHPYRNGHWLVRGGGHMRGVTSGNALPICNALRGAPSAFQEGGDARKETTVASSTLGHAGQGPMAPVHTYTGGRGQGKGCGEREGGGGIACADRSLAQWLLLWLGASWQEAADWSVRVTPSCIAGVVAYVLTQRGGYRARWLWPLARWILRVHEMGAWHAARLCEWCKRFARWVDETIISSLMAIVERVVNRLAVEGGGMAPAPANANQPVRDHANGEPRVAGAGVASSRRIEPWLKREMEKRFGKKAVADALERHGDDYYVWRKALELVRVAEREGRKAQQRPLREWMADAERWQRWEDAETLRHEVPDPVKPPEDFAELERRAGTGSLRVLRRHWAEVPNQVFRRRLLERFRLPALRELGLDQERLAAMGLDEWGWPQDWPRTADGLPDLLAVAEEAMTPRREQGGAQL